MNGVHMDVFDFLVCLLGCVEVFVFLLNIRSGGSLPCGPLGILEGIARDLVAVLGSRRPE